jgi:RimJ/RimL family protein N-acetyltransferase
MLSSKVKIDAEIELTRFAPEMAEELALLADDRSIWIHSRDSMPYPYDYYDALGFTKATQEESTPQTFAILFKGVLAGACVLISGTDVHRHTAEVGYWVGRPFRRKRIAFRVVKKLVEIGFKERGFLKLKASVFSNNTASAELLKKIGFREEARLKNEILKDDSLQDEIRFALFPEGFGALD